MVKMEDAVWGNGVGDDGESCPAMLVSEGRAAFCDSLGHLHPGDIVGIIVNTPQQHLPS